ncbi:hypothetical protein DSO57_1028545 [Entomophthora muscae]|uniref:Uncharacterized protein n=1 Tax=Entomophthora muscae TaxID=34485 RepID=A0ACC2TCK7_9FUNG|nr:hypothetical protein DSO57_1028545 [Entomophthora muscae]
MFRNVRWPFTWLIYKCGEVKEEKMKFVELPLELLHEVASRIKDIPSLAGLAGTSRLLRRVAMSDRRLQVLYDCHAVMTAKSNCTDGKHSSMNPFSNEVKRLNLIPKFNTHRHALYAIQENWRWLDVEALEIRGEIDCVAGVKLSELFESATFKTHHITFTCCNFYDDELYNERPLIGLFKAIFKGKCAHLTFDRCAFDEGSLSLLLEMFGTSKLSAFHFKYNFVDEMPVKELCRSIASHRTLVDLDMSSVGMGWDHTFLVDFLDAVSKTSITNLTIRHNDLGLDLPPNILLPTLPKLKRLNIVGNSLYSANTRIIRRWLDSLTLTELVLDRTGIKDIHLWPYPITNEA